MLVGGRIQGPRREARQAVNQGQTRLHCPAPAASSHQRAIHLLREDPELKRKLCLGQKALILARASKQQEKEKELKSFLMRVKEESVKVGLKLNIQKN